MFAEAATNVSLMSEKTLRRQIDRAISRALFDGEYASALLDDPTVVLEDRGCAPQQYLSLRSIQASDLNDFARQALARFGIAEPLQFDSSHARRYLKHEEQHQLAAVAAR
jgi:hypothetical protein